MAKFNESVQLQFSANSSLPYSFAHLLGNPVILERGFKILKQVDWNCDKLTLPADPLVMRYQNKKDIDFAEDFGDDGIAECSLNGSKFSAVIYSTSLEKASEIEDRLHLLAPVSDDNGPNVVPVDFWSNSSQGPVSRRRKLTVAGWKEIRDNYSHKAQNALDRLFDKDWRPGSLGQLMLWYGPAGTGKTTALRALATEWREWCEIHYITDPELFFGANSNYMLDVLLKNNKYDDDEEEQDDEKWRLLVLEDTGELISADAKERAGSGLSRFLNVVDGLIGQGLKVMILVTTNEDLKKLHPAVSRPGRCAARIQFSQLDNEEVRKWMTNHEINDYVQPSSLADLYSYLHEEKGIIIAEDDTKRIGF